MTDKLPIFKCRLYIEPCDIYIVRKVYRLLYFDYVSEWMPYFGLPSNLSEIVADVDMCFQEYQQITEIDEKRPLGSQVFFMLDRVSPLPSTPKSVNVETHYHHEGVKDYIPAEEYEFKFNELPFRQDEVI